MKSSSALDMAAWWLVIIGGLNWLVQGVTKEDLVGRIFNGSGSTMSRVVYVVVGVAAVWSLGMALGKKDA